MLIFARRITIRASERMFYGAFFGSIGALILGYCALAHVRNRRARSWPQVPGVIVGHDVRYETDRDEHGSSTTWRLDVEYEYAVSGRSYRGSRLRFGPLAQYETESAARTAGESRYGAGALVTVYYKPTDPAIAVLDPTLSGSEVRLLLCYGLLFLALGVAAFVW